MSCQGYARYAGSWFCIARGVWVWVFFVVPVVEMTRKLMAPPVKAWEKLNVQFKDYKRLCLSATVRLGVLTPRPYRPVRSTFVRCPQHPASVKFKECLYLFATVASDYDPKFWPHNRIDRRCLLKFVRCPQHPASVGQTIIERFGSRPWPSILPRLVSVDHGIISFDILERWLVGPLLEK